MADRLQVFPVVIARHRGGFVSEICGTFKTWASCQSIINIGSPPAHLGQTTLYSFAMGWPHGRKGTPKRQDHESQRRHRHSENYPGLPEAPGRYRDDQADPDACVARAVGRQSAALARLRPEW